jgi:hypothetical protein
MSLPPPRVILTLIWVQILILGVVNKPAIAQEGSQIGLAPIDTEEFPRISSYLDVRTPEGDFVFGLEEPNVRIIEDGTRLPVNELEHIRTGVQFVLAVSPGPAFDIRDVQGVSRYEYLEQALVDWAKSRDGSTVDDLRIIVPDGPESTHIAEFDRWVAFLNSFAPTGSETGPDFDILAQALDVAADPTTNPGMARAVLFVTPLPGQDVSLGLQSLAARASQQGVKIFIWLVASAELFPTPQAEQLATLADQTGGKMFAYSGQESIPSPEQYLEGIRNAYSLVYDSRITTSGPHQVSAEVNFNGQYYASPVQEFDIEVMPPSIAFVSPPMKIERINLAEEGDPELLSPDSQHLELLVEFPDGHVRSLKETTLYVDGEMTEINRTDPFDQFTWDLSEYPSSGEHILVVVVEDNLGMTGKTVETTIQITSGDSGTSALSVVSQNRTMLAAIVVAISGAVLLLVLVLGGRLHPGFFREFRRRKKLSDPVTQPVVFHPEQTTQSRSTWINRFQWPRGRITSKSYAHMVPISDSNQEESHPPIAIVSELVTFGRDAGQADQVIEDDSVEKLHARLQRESKGVFRLSDEGSIAGTWVNYSPVSKDGAILEQGDLIHIGRAGFRFIMRDPHRVRKPVQRRKDSVP